MRGWRCWPALLSKFCSKTFLDQNSGNTVPTIIPSPKKVRCKISGIRDNDTDKLASVFSPFWFISQMVSGQSIILPRVKRLQYEYSFLKLKFFIWFRTDQNIVWVLMIYLTLGIWMALMIATWLQLLIETDLSVAEKGKGEFYLSWHY